MPTFNVGAFVLGAPTSPRVLVHHEDLFVAYADGTMAERGEDREAYLSHFVFGEELQRYYAANRNSVAGFAGPCWCRWLVLDIDRPDLADARRLVMYLRQRYDTDDVLIYFSGAKGLHVAVELVHNPPPSVGFPAVAKAFAENIARAAGVAIDLAIYDRNHIIRLPNTRHPKTGLYKRRIDADDLLRLDIEGIRRHAAHPAGDGLPTWRGDTARLAADWQNAEAETARATEGRTATYRDSRPDERAPRYLIEFLRFGVESGERATMLFRASAWLAEQGAPPSLVFALLTEPGLDCGLSPSETARQIKCGIEHALRQRGATPTADPRPDPVLEPDAFEAWAIRHENDPLPEGATDFLFGANVSEGGTT